MTIMTKGTYSKAPSSTLLKEWGYVPLFEDVKLDDGKIWEDWWVDPNQVSKEVLSLASKGETL